VQRHSASLLISRLSVWACATRQHHYRRTTGWLKNGIKNKNPEGCASSQPEAAMLETWQIGMKCCSMRGDDETMACSALEFELT
jgi:hypothetical protein